jgi:rhodanese-related sulfurtransferase
MTPITREELKRMLERNENFVLIDVLDEDEFQDYHLPRARNIPLRSPDFAEQVRNLVPDQDTQIIVYCADIECQASGNAAETLEALGYCNVRDYSEGKEDWREAGYPLVQTTTAA